MTETHPRNTIIIHTRTLLQENSWQEFWAMVNSLQN